MSYLGKVLPEDRVPDVATAVHIPTGASAQICIAAAQAWVGLQCAYMAGMTYRLAYRSQSSARAGSAPAARAMKVAEAMSWAAMVLGLATASLLLVQSYFFGG